MQLAIPFVIDNQAHLLSDALKTLLTQTVGKPLDIATAYFAISGYRRGSWVDGPDGFTMKAKEIQP